MKRSVVLFLAFLYSALIVPLSADAVDAPHYDPARGYSCATCHTEQLTLGSTGYNNVCLFCHSPGNPAAGKKPFTPADAADPFGAHITAGISRLHQTSHRWDGTDTVPAAGAQPPLQAAMTSSSLRARSANELGCVRCHNPHFNTNGKFLRIPNNQDQLCLDCHRSRNVSSHLLGSHPVNINYDSAAAAKPGKLNTPPVNSNPANPSSSLDAQLVTSNRNLICSTCHGVHYTDSRSSTIDGSANFANLSTGDGYQLRTDHRGAAAISGQPDKPNICTNCHAGKKNHNLQGQDVQCADCHGAHVEYDPNDPTGSKGTNTYLIKRNITKAGQPSQIFFRYTGSRREYVNSQGNGVCQACHVVPLPGGSYPPEHASTDPAVCNKCHFHNGTSGSFSGTCASCHGFPPITATIGGPTGLATPATKASATPGAHETHAKNRAMVCNTCHNGYKSKAMPSNSIDIGFAINGSNFPGFSGDVTGGTYTNTNTLAAPYTFSGAVSTSGANQTCANIYCHGATLSGGSNPTPSWTGTNQAACGTCHGATAASPPTTAGHLRHAGSGVAGRLALTCSACHGATPDNSHINGSVTWNLSALGAAAQYKTPLGDFAAAGSTQTTAPSAVYGQCNNIYCHSTVQGAGGLGAPSAYSQPSWGGVALGCGSCHKDMATDAGATGSHIKHVQVLGLSCATCHNGLGHDVASHADGKINLAFSGAASGTVYSKGTSFVPGSGYGSCTTSCHSIPPTWGTAFATDCTGCHGGNAASGNVIASGMHAKHINQVPVLSSNVACAACHNATVSPASDRVITTSANHANGTVNVVFAGGGTYANGTCSSTSCHGATLPASNPPRTSPSWNTPFPTGTPVLGDGIAGGNSPGSGYCAQCHGYPPQNGHASSGCSSCHAHLNPDNRTFNNAALHINGIVEALSANCDSCHGYPPASAGFVGTQNNWSNAKPENYPGGGGAHTIQNHVNKLAKPSEGFSNCAKCHNAADHKISPLAFNPSQNIKVSVNQSFRMVPARQAKYSSNRLDANAHLTGTCSNISCHIGATPKWDPAR